MVPFTLKLIFLIRLKIMGFDVNELTRVYLKETFY